MSTYVLIHGAFHGGWCWDRVAPLLKEQGHTVIAPDLPGHGSDKTPMHEVTLQAYADKVCKVVNAQSEPVILLGHSMGGMVITRAAEQCASKIKKLVYLTAILQGDGEPMIKDENSLIQPNMIPSADQSFFTIKDDMIKQAFYGGCSDEDVAWAKSKLTPQSATPLGQSSSTVTTKENYGSLPRVYIECLRDKAISPVAQKELYSKVPCEQVIAIDTDHSPFLSDPEGLAAHLHGLST